MAKSKTVPLNPGYSPEQLSCLLSAIILYDNSIPLVADEYRKTCNAEITPAAIKALSQTYARQIALKRIELLEKQELNPLASRRGRLAMLWSIYKNAAGAIKRMKNGSEWSEASEPDRACMLRCLELAESLSVHQREEEQQADETDYSSLADGDAETEDELDIGDDGGMATWPGYDRDGNRISAESEGNFQNR